MAKLPWMHFYPADYVRDTRGLPDFARGIWMDMICYLWDAPKRGTATLPVEMWIAICGTTAANMETALFTFPLANICEVKRECNGHVTVMCRRMIRDEKVRELTRLRVGRARVKEHSNGDVTLGSRSCNSESHVTSLLSPQTPLSSLTLSSLNPNLNPNLNLNLNLKIKEQGLDQGLNNFGARDEAFDEFWEVYPKRNGKKIGKAKARMLFSQLVSNDQKLCVLAARNYAASSRAQEGFIRDADRFLKADYWREWIEPETPQALALTKQRPLTPFQQMIERAKEAASHAHERA